MKTFDHTSLADMCKLSGQVYSMLGNPKKVSFCSYLVDNSLMIPSNLLVRLSMWIVKKRVGTTADLWIMLEDQYPGVLDDLIGDTCQWITSGKDKSDPKSAGGFNAQEVQLLETYFREYL